MPTILTSSVDKSLKLIDYMTGEVRKVQCLRCGRRLIARAGRENIGTAQSSSIVL